MGRDPKKPSLRGIDGGQAHRPDRTPPQPRVIKPRAPSWLTREQRIAFRAIVRELDAMTGAFACDVELITSMAIHFDRLREINIQLCMSGSKLVVSGARNDSVVNPLVRLQLSTQRDLIKLSDKLFKNPEIRARLDVEITDPLMQSGSGKRGGLAGLRDSLLN
jgi:phage terminase small subunit